MYEPFSENKGAALGLYFCVCKMLISHDVAQLFVVSPDADEDTLGPEGMEKFCEDIGVEPENVGLCTYLNGDGRQLALWISDQVQRKPGCTVVEGR